MTPYPPYSPRGGTNPPYHAVSQPSYNQPPSHPPVTQPQTTVNAKSPRPFSAQSSISEDTIKTSLLSAVEDKLRRQIRATFEQAQVCSFCMCVCAGAGAGAGAGAVSVLCCA